MAKNSVSDWSSNADQNTDINGINIDEGCPPSGINNAIRAIMAQVAVLLPTLIRGGSGIVNDLLNAAVKRFGNASTIYDTSATAVERALGYRTLPFTAARSAAYTIALTDVAMCVPISTGGITVPASATTAFAQGDIIAVFNNGSASQAITGASGVTLTLAGSLNVGARTVSQNGLATLLNVGTDSWLVYGIGVG